MPSMRSLQMAVETLGAWGAESLKFIQDLGSRIQDASGDKRSTSFLFQRLGICVQRGNAAAILGTLPKSRRLDELYNL